MRILIAAAAIVLELATGAAAQPMPNDPYASLEMQRIADHVEATAHFSVSALECGQWGAGEEAAFRAKYSASVYFQLHGEDQHYAWALYESGATRARRGFATNPKLECDALRNQDFMGRLRELAAGTRSFWKWP